MAIVGLETLPPEAGEPSTTASRREHCAPAFSTESRVGLARWSSEEVAGEVAGKSMVLPASARHSQPAAPAANGALPASSSIGSFLEKPLGAMLE